MKWSSAISENESLKPAIEECLAVLSTDLGTERPDLLLVFVSSSHRGEYEDIPSWIHSSVNVNNLIGCSGGGIIGNGKEVENKPAVAITGATLPDVTLNLFHVENDELPTLDDNPGAWEELVKVTADQKPHFILLADPFSIQAENLIMGLDYAFQGGTKIGGLASGGARPGTNSLFLDHEVYRSGAVGLAMHGNIGVDTIVAQGCRPIGKPTVVTQCDKNVLSTLDGETPLDVLKKIFEESDTYDKGLINSALHVGIVMDSLKDEFKPGDFLIRNVMGLQQESGALVVGEMMHEGQVVQFHVRDASTAEQDLENIMDRYVAENDTSATTGALLFSCLGRGEHLFGQPNHDSDIFLDKVSKVPLSGFFCNGEIGQVGGSTFLHGFTSSFAMFKPKTPAV